MKDYKFKQDDLVEFDMELPSGSLKGKGIVCGIAMDMGDDVYYIVHVLESNRPNIMGFTHTSIFESEMKKVNFI